MENFAASKAELWIGRMMSALFGVYLGILMWGGLWLRDPQPRALFPFRR